MNLKSGSFLFVSIGLLIIIVFFDSPLPVLVAVIGFMFGYSYWKWKNKFKATAEVNIFVSSYIKPEMIWPSKIVISEKSLQELNMRLTEGKITLPQATINKIVEDTLVKQISLRFEASFYEHNKDLPKEPSLNQWIEAYVRTFNRNMDYVPMLRRLMKKREVRIPLKALTEKITEEMNKQRDIKKMNKAHS